MRREHPSRGGLDDDFELASDSSERRRFVGSVPLPRHGRWRLIGYATTGDARVEQVLDLEVAR